MKFYGEIETNICKLLEKQDKLETGYSIDSIMLESPDGQTFDIDFEEADYSEDNESIVFRLKAMGTTFEETWEDLKRTDGVEFEEDYEFLRTCKLKSISLYLPTEYKHTEYEIDFKVIECDLLVGSGRVKFDVGDVVVELF